MNEKDVRAAVTRGVERWAAKHQIRRAILPGLVHEIVSEFMPACICKTFGGSFAVAEFASRRGPWHLTRCPLFDVLYGDGA